MTASTALVDNNLLPFTSFLIEPAKVLFLNNALNHGVLTPLGLSESAESGKSILFLLEANPAAGLGLLLAYSIFGKGLAKASAPGAAIIHFFGGIHEIYFPYVLMKPKLILAMIAGGFTQILINVIFGSGLRSPAAPGSIFAVYLAAPTDLQEPRGRHPVDHRRRRGVVRGRRDPAEDRQDRGGRGPAGRRHRTRWSRSRARARRSPSLLTGGAATAVATRPISKIVFACDAGMGSSAMGASVLRKKIQDAGHADVTVVNQAIANLTDDYDLVVTHQDLTDARPAADTVGCARVGRQLPGAAPSTTRSSS